MPVERDVNGAVKQASEEKIVFGGYWRHKQARAEAARLPRPVLRAYPAPGFSETETIYWSRCRACRRILDVGSGDNALKHKFVTAGFTGVYETVDVSQEADHDYQSVDHAAGEYDGILMLDVIEHMRLPAFYGLIDRVEQLIAPGGVVIISTPNPACIRSMWAGDMTHVQQYPLDDLIAVFLTRGYSCEAYRVLYQNAKQLTWFDQLRLLVQKALVTQVLGADYADGLLVVARKSRM